MEQGPPPVETTTVGVAHDHGDTMDEAPSRSTPPPPDAPRYGDRRPDDDGADPR